MEPASEAGAALSGPPSTFQIDDDVFEVTGAWRVLLEHLTRDDWHLGLLLDLLDEDDADEIEDRLSDWDDPLTLLDVEDIAEDLVAAATGHPPWVVQRLLAWVESRWPEVDGDLTLRGVDLVELLDTAPARACNALYAWMLAGLDQDGRHRLDAELFKPPPEVAVDPPDWVAEDEGSSFLSAMAAARSVGATPAGTGGD